MKKHKIRQPISEVTKFWETFSLLDITEILDVCEMAASEVPPHRDTETANINLQVHYIRANIKKLYKNREN